MSDMWKIILGVLIFLVLVTYPIWYGLFCGRGAPPELEKAATGTECVESTEYMRDSHMTLINEWRDSVVRDGNRVYTNSQGKQYAMSLQNTCLQCHQNRKNFCDRCHTYVSVAPNCWDCHIAPDFQGNNVAWRNE